MFGELLARIGACTLRNNVPYMIIGGQAMMLYCEPRFTFDIDVMLGIDARCLNLLLFIVNDLKLKVIPEDPKAFVKQTMVLPAIEESTAIRVDFIVSSTPYEKEAIGRAARIRVQDQIVRFSTAEDLIIHKVITGNRLDIEDVRKILSRHRELNHSLIRRTLKDFDIRMPGNHFPAVFEDILVKSAENSAFEGKKDSSRPSPPGTNF
jgi:hypothetical protein